MVDSTSKDNPDWVGFLILNQNNNNNEILFSFRNQYMPKASNFCHMPTTIATNSILPCVILISSYDLNVSRVTNKSEFKTQKLIN